MKDAHAKTIGTAVVSAAFLLAEGTFFVLEILGIIDYRLEFVAVALACFFALLCLIFYRSLELIFLLGAMIFTVVADVLLVLIGDHYEAAVALFLVVQFLHAARLYAARGRVFRSSLVIRAGLSLAGVVALVIIGEASLLTILAVLYFAELLMNAADSLRLGGSERRLILAFIGFLLFVCCDVTVGIKGMADAWRVSSGLYDALDRLTWIFYIPSQTLIVLSALKLRWIFPRKNIFSEKGI